MHDSDYVSVYDYVQVQVHVHVHVRPEARKMCRMVRPGPEARSPSPSQTWCGAVTSRGAAAGLVNGVSGPREGPV